MEVAVLAAGLGAIAVSIVLVVLLLLTRRDPGESAGSLASYVPGSRHGEPGAERLPGGELMRRLALRLSPAGAADKLRRRLDVAGNPRGWTPERILSYKGIGLVGLGLFFSLGTLRSLGGGLLAGLLGAAIGFFLPDVLLYNAGLHRQEKLRRALPDVLDLLCVSVEAGLGFDAALSRVARNTSGPLAAELVRVLQEMQIGKSREESLRAMADRAGVEEIQLFVSALVQAGELGIPIGAVLREQAREMRIKRRQRAEETAQKLPVKITFPVILCIFPALFVVAMGPGIISMLDSFLAR